MVSLLGSLLLEHSIIIPVQMIYGIDSEKGMHRYCIWGKPINRFYFWRLNQNMHSPCQSIKNALCTADDIAQQEKPKSKSYSFIISRTQFGFST